MDCIWKLVTLSFYHIKSFHVSLYFIQTRNTTFDAVIIVILLTNFSSTKFPIFLNFLKIIVLSFSTACFAIGALQLAPKDRVFHHVSKLKTFQFKFIPRKETVEIGGKNINTN